MKITGYQDISEYINKVNKNNGGMDVQMIVISLAYHKKAVQHYTSYINYLKNIFSSSSSINFLKPLIARFFLEIFLHKLIPSAYPLCYS